jgi:hypothetical protein
MTTVTVSMMSTQALAKLNRIRMQVALIITGNNQTTHKTSHTSMHLLTSMNAYFVRLLDSKMT